MSVKAVHMVLDPGQKLEADLGGWDDGSGPVDSLARDLGVARSGQRLGDEAVHGLGCEAGPWPGRPQPRGEECGPGDAVALDTEDLVGVPHVPVDGQQGGQEGQGQADGVEDGEDGGGHSWVWVLRSLFSGRGGDGLAVTESDAHTGLVLTTADIWLEW